MVYPAKCFLFNNCFVITYSADERVFGFLLTFRMLFSHYATVKCTYVLVLTRLKECFSFSPFDYTEPSLVSFDEDAD